MPDLRQTLPWWPLMGVVCVRVCVLLSNNRGGGVILFLDEFAVHWFTSPDVGYLHFSPVFVVAFKYRGTAGRQCLS